MHQENNGLKPIKENVNYLRSYLPRHISLRNMNVVLMINKSTGIGLYDYFHNPYMRGAKDSRKSDTYVIEISSPQLMYHMGMVFKAAEEQRIVENIHLYSNHFKFEITKMYDTAYRLFQEEMDMLCRQVDFNDVVIFGRIESIVDYFLQQYLLDKGYPKEDVINMFISKELQRLSPLEDRIDILEKKVDDKVFSNMIKAIPRTKVNVIRVAGLNIDYNGRTFGIIDRPWGRDMAYAFMKNILENADPKKVLAVGGCGSLVEGTQIDDIVVPSSVSAPDCTYQLEKTLNAPYQEVVCVNVNSPLDEDEEFCKNNEGTVIEMEMSGIAKALDKTGIPFFVSLYVLDLPKENITLGDTYHNDVFLGELFRRRIRGKNQALEFLLNQTK